jgi:predicted unusual protein kinase regulating ubiquinone biosynthesis (AarF/ABC1/UbiB family)
MRAIVVFLKLLPFVVAFLRDRRRFIVFGGRARRTEAQHERRALRLTATLAGLGPAFIKLAQVFGSRADILPEPYLGAMATLTDRVPPLEAGAAERVVLAELGESVDTIFDRFDPEPLAAASLGQVHRATFQGRDVVVKILRPGVEDVIRQDLNISFRILFLLNLLFPGHQVRAMSAIVSEFAKRIAEELDFHEEARNAATLRRNFAGDAGVVVPEVVAPLTRQRVLVLEYMEGTRVDRLHARLASGELELRTVVAAVVRVYVKMMLEDGFFHADPHPGNLLIDPQGRLVMLDFGMVLRVEQELRVRLIKTVLAAARQDVDGVINGFYALGILDPDVDRATVRDAAQQLMSVTMRDDMSPRQVQRFVEEVLRTFYEWPLILPSDLVYFGRAAVLVEGLAYRYDPNFNMVAVARPFVATFSRRLIEGALGRDPAARLTDWTADFASAVATMRDLLRRVEREELRVRWHPRDTMELQRFLAQQVRRGLLALLAFTVGLIATVVWAVTRRFEILTLGLVLSFGMFLVIFVLPSHLFQNPLRLRRRWPKR